MLLAFSVTPMEVDVDLASARNNATRIVRESGLPHRIDPLFTTIEGEWDEVFDIVKSVMETIRNECSASIIIKADLQRVDPGIGELQRIEASLPSGEITAG